MGTTAAQTVSTTDQVFSGEDFGSTILVPINSNDISINYGDIVIFTIRVEYNPDVLTYTGYSNLNPAFPSLLISVNPAGAEGVVQFNVEDQAFAGFTFPDGKMFDIEFTLNGGQTELEITLAEFLDATFFESYYPPTINGSVEGYTTLFASDGNWNEASTWTGFLGSLTQPGLGHNVVIEDGGGTGIVVIPNDGVCNSLQI